MCAGYGLELAGPNSTRRERPGLGGGELRSPFPSGSIPPGDTAAGRQLLEAWIAEQRGTARITGRNARNLNPIIRVRSDERELSLGWWWLHVGGAPAKFSAFNARADRLIQSWHAPFQHRALLPATWYIEKGVRFALPAGEEFGMAAVTAPLSGDTFGQLGGSPVAAAGDPLPAVDSYALVTRDALGAAADTHDRMPLVLPRALHDDWLDPGRVGDADLVREVLAVSAEISREMIALGQDPQTAPKAGSNGANVTAPAEQPRLF